MAFLQNYCSSREKTKKSPDDITMTSPPRFLRSHRPAAPDDSLTGFSRGALFAGPQHPSCKQLGHGGLLHVYKGFVSPLSLSLSLGLCFHIYVRGSGDVACVGRHAGPVICPDPGGLGISWPRERERERERERLLEVNQRCCGSIPTRRSMRLRAQPVVGSVEIRAFPPPPAMDSSRMPLPPYHQMWS